MLIELRSSNLALPTALRDHAARRIASAVGRFATHVDGVIVRVVDVNGPRGGLDKRCRIIARLSGTRSVLVEGHGADAYAAVSLAAARLGERVARTLARQRSLAA